MSETKFTSRGFAIRKYEDLYKAKYSIQKSSLAAIDAIWFGIDEANPRILKSHAINMGIAVEPLIEGWMRVQIPENVLFTTRMHLGRSQVAELIPVLQHFVDTGELPDHTVSEEDTK